MAQLGKVSPTTAVKAFAKGAPSGGGSARSERRIGKTSGNFFGGPRFRPEE
jgi:hypothetical protein